MKLTGAAILVSRGMKVYRRPRQLILIVMRQDSRMADLMLESIARTRQRPAMYIGAHSAEAMFLYLAGYSGALQDHTDIDLTKYMEFVEFLYTKYGRGGGGHSWAWVLGQKTGSDSAALDLFYDELDRFLKRKA